jgi:hypothetical protein
VATILASWIALPTVALADGMLVWGGRQVDIVEPTQKAFILFDHGAEDLVLEVRFAGAPREFGWLVPLPAEPRLLPDRPGLFEHLSVATWWPQLGHSIYRRPVYEGISAAGRGVTDVRRERVGIYDTTILRAGDGRALQDWLKRHGFRTRAGATHILADYMRRRWVFVAMRIAVRDSTDLPSLHDGTIQPIRFQFPTARPVYPLSVSSATSGGSDVLIYMMANGPVANATCTRAQWDIHPYGPDPGWWEVLDPSARFPGLRTTGGYLTKMRAVLRPRDMEDLRFKPYDAFAALHSVNERGRAEAATALGRRKPPGARDSLVALLRRRNGGGDDVLSAIWALGEVGGERAVSALVTLSGSTARDVRLEALDALARTRSREGPPVFVGRLGQLASCSGMWVDVERQICLGHVIALGDPACIPALQAIPRRPRSSDALKGGNGYPSGAETDVLAALAACGDVEAREETVDRLVREGADLTSRKGLERTAASMRGSYYNDFPASFWTGFECREPHFEMANQWSSHSAFDELLQDNPMVRDSLYRRAARDPRMPDAGRLVLTSHVGRESTDDQQLVMGAWERAIGSDRIVLSLQWPRSTFARRVYSTVSCNANACAAAYTLASLHDSDGLLRLWRECPRSDDHLRGEIAWAMARCGDPRLVVPVAEYTVQSWQPLFEARKPGEEGTEVVPQGARTIAPFVAGDSVVLRRLITDRTLHPGFRLLWIDNTQFRGTANRSLYPVVMAELEHMECGAGRDPYVTVAVADRARRQREHLLRELGSPSEVRLVQPASVHQ